MDEAEDEDERNTLREIRLKRTPLAALWGAQPMKDIEGFINKRIRAKTIKERIEVRDLAAGMVCKDLPIVEIMQ